jgi:hypothetical protein
MRSKLLSHVPLPHMMNAALWTGLKTDPPKVSHKGPISSTAKITIKISQATLTIPMLLVSHCATCTRGVSMLMCDSDGRTQQHRPLKTGTTPPPR